MSVQEIIETFEFFDDWEERYRYIIELGRDLAPLAESHRNPINKVEGCISQVWLIHKVVEEPERIVRFEADSDSHIVKGLIAILMALYSEKTPAAILDTDIEGLFNQLGLSEHLSVNRRNGFYSMVGRIQATARALA